MSLKNNGSLAILGESFGASGKGLYVTKIFEELKKDLNLKLYLRDTAPYDSEDVVKIKTFKTDMRFLAGLGYYIPLFFHLLKNKDIKAMHAFDERIGLFAGLLGRPLVITIHDLSPLRWGMFSNFLFRILYMLSARGKYILVDSEYTEKALKKKFPFLSKKVKRIYLGTDLNKFKPGKKKIGKKVKIGILGDLDNELKNVFKRISKEHREDVEIIIGGRIPKAEFDFLKSEPNITFKGFIKDSNLPSYYRGLDVFVYKHVLEGFGFIPLEAMASGCAVVASNSASIPEVVGEGGLLVENKEEEFYRGIKSIIENRKLISIYSKKGRKRAEKFPWKKCSKEYNKIYKEILDESKK